MQQQEVANKVSLSLSLRPENVIDVQSMGAGPTRRHGTMEMITIERIDYRFTKRMRETSTSLNSSIGTGTRWERRSLIFLFLDPSVDECVGCETCPCQKLKEEEEEEEEEETIVAS